MDYEKSFIMTKDIILFLYFLQDGRKIHAMKKENPRYTCNICNMWL